MDRFRTPMHVLQIVVVGTHAALVADSTVVLGRGSVDEMNGRYTAFVASPEALHRAVLVAVQAAVKPSAAHICGEPAYCPFPPRRCVVENHAATLTELANWGDPRIADLRA